MNNRKEIPCKICYGSYPASHKIQTLPHTHRFNYNTICFYAPKDGEYHHLIVWLNAFAERECMEIVCGICKQSVEIPKEKLNETWARLNAFFCNPEHSFPCPEHTLNWNIIEKWKEDEQQS